MVEAQHTYRDWLKAAAKKTVAKDDHQNQAINIDIFNKQYMKSGTRLTREKLLNFSREFIKRVLIERCSLV